MKPRDRVSPGANASAAIVALVAVALGTACSGDDTGGEDSAGSSDGDEVAVVVDPDAPGMSPRAEGRGGSLREGTFGEGSCAGQIYEAEAIPADIYVMFDSSGSMDGPAAGGRRLDAVRAALLEFVAAPESAGLGVGLGVFGHLPLGYTSCDPADYAEPIARFGLLPGYATNMSLALEVLRPIGETPTGGAIRGACEYTRDWKRGHAGHYVAILLVTDGVPEAVVTPGCDPTLQDAVDAATDCASGSASEQIPTYVIGVGTALDSLNQIAAAGGTERAYLVESDDVAADMLDALNAIRGGSVIQCEYQIPQPSGDEPIDYGMVNVQYVDAEANEYDIYFAGDEAGCDAALGGWYYDDPTAPSRLLLCEATCNRVTEDNSGRLGIAYGCNTVNLPE